MRKSILPLLILPLLLSSSIFPVIGDVNDQGIPTFLGVWNSTPYGTNRIIDTTKLSGDVTLDLNVTNAHFDGLIGLAGFDLIVTYNPAILKARAAGISGSFWSFPPPLGTWNGIALTPTPRLLFVGAGSSWVSGNTVVYDNTGSGLFAASDPVIAGTAPALGTLLKQDPKIKWVDAETPFGNGLWESPEVVVYDSNSNGVFDAGDVVIGPPGAVAPPVGTVLTSQIISMEPSCPGCDFDLVGRDILLFREQLDITQNLDGTLSSTPGRSEVVLGMRATGLPNAGPTGVVLRLRFSVVGPGSTDVTISPSSNMAVGLGQFINYIPIPGFFSNVPAPSYGVFASPQKLSVQPTGSASATLSMGGVLGTPGTVSLKATDLGDPPSGTPLASDPRIKFVDANGNNVWDPGEAVIYDTPNKGVYGTAGPAPDVVINGTAPVTGTPLKVDPKIRFVDADGNLVWDKGEAVVYDSDGDFVYDRYSYSRTPVIPYPGETVITGTVGVTFTPSSGTPPFTSTVSITTNLFSARRDVGASGNHTIIINATSTGIPRGIFTVILLTIQFPPVSFGASVNRNLVPLRPGENSPDVRFIDNNGNGVYDPGVDTLVLDTLTATFSAFKDTSLLHVAKVTDVVVNGTARQVQPQVRFWDNDLSGVYATNKTLVYDPDNNGFIDAADTIVSVTPARMPNSTELGTTPDINGLICGGAPKGSGSLGCPLTDALQQWILFIPHTGSNGIYAPGLDTLILDRDKNGVVDSATSTTPSDLVLSVTPVVAASGGQLGLGLMGEMGKPLLKANEVGQVLLSEPRIRSIGTYSPGVTLVFDANNNGVVDTGDTVVSVTPVRAPVAGELGQNLTLVPNVKFIDLRANGNYASSLSGGPPDTLLFDATQDGVVDPGDVVVSVTPTRIPKPRMMFVPNAPGMDINRYDVGETLVYDGNSDGLYTSHATLSLQEDIVLSGTAPANNTSILPVNTFATVTWTGGGPETVDLVPSLLPKPLDPTVRLEVDQTSGVVSGPVLAGVPTSTLVSDISFITLSSSGPSSLPGALLPINYTISLTARSRLSSVSVRVTTPGQPTLILSKLGYRYDLPFDYKVTISTPAPIATTCAPVANVCLSGGQVFTQTILVNVTQGIPQNITLTRTGTAIAEPSIHLSFSVPASPSSFNTTLTYTIGTILSFDPKVKFVNATTSPTETWSSGKAVIYDGNGDGLFASHATPSLQDDIVIIGAAPANNTKIRNDPKIKYVDSDNNKVWDCSALSGGVCTAGESVVYDNNNNNLYDPLGSYATTTCPCTLIPADIVIFGATPRVTPSGGYTITVTGSPAGATPAQETISNRLCIFFQGDVNRDGVVNFLDKGRIGASFFGVASQAGFDTFADVNKDGFINFLDLGTVGLQFFQSC